MTVTTNFYEELFSCIEFSNNEIASFLRDNMCSTIGNEDASLVAYAGAGSSSSAASSSANEPGTIQKIVDFLKKFIQKVWNGLKLIGRKILQFFSYIKTKLLAAFKVIKKKFKDFSIFKLGVITNVTSLNKANDLVNSAYRRWHNFMTGNSGLLIGRAIPVSRTIQVPSNTFIQKTKEAMVEFKAYQDEVIKKLPSVTDFDNTHEDKHRQFESKYKAFAADSLSSDMTVDVAKDDVDESKMEAMVDYIEGEASSFQKNVEANINAYEKTLVSTFAKLAAAQGSTDLHRAEAVQHFITSNVSLMRGLSSFISSKILGRAAKMLSTSLTATYEYISHKIDVIKSFATAAKFLNERFVNDQFRLDDNIKTANVDATYKLLHAHIDLLAKKSGLSRAKA